MISGLYTAGDRGKGSTYNAYSEMCFNHGANFCNKHIKGRYPGGSATTSITRWLSLLICFPGAFHSFQCILQEGVEAVKALLA